LLHPCRHTVANLRIDWRGPNGHAVALQFENLFDTRYADRADFAQGEYRYFPAAQRHVMLEYTWIQR
jgi:outer membrane receptor protein involved in Fe transport